MNTEIIFYNNNYFLIDKINREITLLTEDEAGEVITYDGVKLSKVLFSMWDNNMGATITDDEYYASGQELRDITKLYTLYIK